MVSLENTKKQMELICIELKDTKFSICKLVETRLPSMYESFNK